MDIGVEIMKKRNKKLTELLEQRRALCDKMTHGVPGCGCRNGFCGACATIYRIAGDREGLPRQRVGRPGASL